MAGSRARLLRAAPTSDAGPGQEQWSSSPGALGPSGGTRHGASRGQLCPGPERKELGWPRPSQGALGTRRASGPEPRTGTASPPCPPRRLCRLCPGKRSRLPDRGSLPRKAGGKREIPSCTEPCKWRRVLAGSQRPRPQPLVSKGHGPEAAALFWKCQLGCPALSCPVPCVALASSDNRASLQPPSPSQAPRDPRRNRQAPSAQIRPSQHPGQHRGRGMGKNCLGISLGLECPDASQ